MSVTRVCPSCESEDVEADTGVAAMDININGWICQECGYSGTMLEK